MANGQKVIMNINKEITNLKKSKAFVGYAVYAKGNWHLYEANKNGNIVKTAFGRENVEIRINQLTKLL